MESISKGENKGNVRFTGNEEIVSGLQNMVMWKEYLCSKQTSYSPRQLFNSNLAGSFI